MKNQLVLVSLVIAIGHWLDGGHWFLDGGWVSSTPYAGAGPVADVAGPVVLKLGLKSLAEGWAWVEVLELEPLAHAWA